MKKTLSCFCLAVSLAVSHAQVPYRSVQEELRRRNIYFGNIDGQDSTELKAALERYQDRKGFTPSGEPDRDTLRSLGLLERQPGEAPPEELAWPAEPVLRSDSQIDVKKEALQVAEETGVAPESIAPEAIAESPPRPAKKRARPRTAQNETPEAQEAPEGRESSEARREIIPRQRVTPKEIAHFVKDYLKAVSCNDIRREIRFYSDQVGYFGNGFIDRRIVEHALRGYYEKWPKRRYKMGDVVSYRALPERGQIDVVFRVRFTLQRGRTKVEGETDNRFIINAATEDPRIIAIAESRVRH